MSESKVLFALSIDRNLMTDVAHEAEAENCSANDLAEHLIESGLRRRKANIVTRPEIVNIALDEGAMMPVHAHAADAGYDLRTPKAVTVSAHESAVIDTGVHIEIPAGYAGILKSKSGLNVKHNIIGTGTIDAGYTGSIAVKLYNLGDQDYTFNVGDKIIQIVFYPVAYPAMVSVNSLADTERGEDGFGSTGK